MKWSDISLRLNPLSIAIFYACIGGIWLLFLSTRIISLLLAPEARTILDLSNTIFILVTAWLLFFLIRKSESGIKERKNALTRLNRTLKTYSECHQALIRATDETELMSNICRIIVEVGGYRVAWVGVAQNDDIRSILPVVQWGDKMGYLKNLNVSWSNTDHGRGPTGTAIKTGKPVVVQYIEFDPKWEMWRENALRHGFYSSISLPLMIEGKPFAALVIFSGETHAFDTDELKLLSELADDLSYGISTLRSVTERMKVSQQYRLLASVIEQANEGIFLLNEQGSILYVNPAVERITGLSPSHLVEKNINSLVHQESNKRFYESIFRAFVGGEQRSGHFQFKRDDGMLFELDLISWSVTDNIGNIISNVALVRDVTHEMQLERQLRRAQRMEAIGTLAGGIAHDFNNTLASIITCTEMALDQASEGSTLQELLDVVLSSGLRGKNLVKQILTFSRQGEQERQEVRVDLIVNECLKLFRASLPPSIEIRLHIHKDLGMVFADPTQIHQIVMNLCTNAVHAMRDQAHSVLELDLKNVDFNRPAITGFGNLAPGPYLSLMVKDTGHGMDEKTIEQIFDPFFSTKGQSGTGLGLSVIHGIVTNHGGSITVESKPGAGAKFTVLLPRLQRSEDTIKVKPQAPTSPGSECILLVDDDDNLVFSTQMMLKQLGYKVITRTDPEHALQLFKTEPHRFDLLITDQSMPNMNGTTLAREITRIRPDLPVILCTGFDPAANEGAGSEEPAEFISEIALKPLVRHEISTIIRRVLGEEETAGADNG